MDASKDNPNYGYLCFGQLLQDGLNRKVTPLYERLQTERKTVIPEKLQNSLFLKKLQENSRELRKTYDTLVHCLRYDMPRAMGATEKEADETSMHVAVGTLLICCRNLYEWEMKNLRYSTRSERLMNCRNEFTGFTEPTILELNRLAEHLVDTFSQEDPPTEIQFEMELNPGADMERIQATLDDLTANPEPDELAPKKPKRSFLKTLGYLFVIDRLWPMDD